MCTRDANSNTTRTLQDVWRRTVQVIQLSRPGVRYTYDHADRLLTATYETAVTTLSYDLAGRKVTMTDADMGAWNYSYDALGNLLSQTDARGCLTTLSYDALNRLTGKVNGAVNCGSGNASVSFSYDSTAGGNYGIGRRTGMSDASGSTAWTYDTRGRLTREIKTIGSTPYTSEWTYNSADLPLTMKYPDNEILTYSYHPQLALKSIFSDLGTSGTGDDYYYLQQARYDAAGRMDLQNLGATSLAVNPLLVNDATFYPWNSQGGRLQRLNAGTYASQASLLDLNYGYDAAGNILAILDVVNSSQKQCFAYDTLQRLTSATVGVNDSTCSGSVGNGEYANESYAYSGSTGNLESKTGMGTYTYDTNHKHAVASTSTGWTYQYDLNGNMTRRDPPGSDYFDLIYDAENRIYQVKKNAAVIATFTYDGNSTRVKTILGSTTTVFVGGHYEVSGSVVTKYYLAGSQRIAMRQGGTLYWLFSDHLSSTSKIANASGTLHSQQLYKPWGEGRYTSGTLPTKYQYTGQYSYAGTGANDFGLLFYNARWLDPSLGRFTQADTLVSGMQPLAFDRYAYAANNPLRFADPSGHRTCSAQRAKAGDETCDQNYPDPGKIEQEFFQQFRSPISGNGVDFKNSFGQNRGNYFDTGDIAYHPGVDSHGARMGTHVYAVAPGTVIFVGWTYDYGNIIIVLID